MRNTRFTAALLAACMTLSFAAALCSCSVKEDRSGVPVWLVIADSTRFNPLHYSGAVTFLSWEKGGEALTQKVSTCMEDLCDRTDEMTVAKGKSWVTFLGGLDQMDLTRDSLLVIPYNGQCDSVVAGAENFETYAEEYYLTCAVQRNYIGVTLRFVGDASLESCPYSIHVKGDVCGLNAKTLEPFAGSYLYVPEESSPFEYRFCLPRQSDYTATVEIWGREMGGSSEVFFGTFELGEYLRKVGYSLDAADLLPVEIDLDFARSAVTVTIESWIEVLDLDIVI